MKCVFAFLIMTNKVNSPALNILVKHWQTLINRDQKHIPKIIMVHLDYFCYCVSLRAGAFIIIVVDLIVCTIIIYGTRGKQEEDVISINVFDVKWKNRSFLPDSYFGLGVVQSCIKAERAAAICHCFGCVILFLGALIVSDAHGLHGVCLLMASSCRDR